LSYHIGEYQQAIEYLEKVLEMDQTSYRALQHLIWTYREMGEFDKALNYANRLASLFPKSVDAITTIAIIYTEKGDYASARQLTDKIEIDTSNYAEAWGLVWHYWFNGQIELGKQIVSKLYEKRFNLGNISPSDVEAAMASYNKDPYEVIRIREQEVRENPRLVGNLGNDYWITNQLEKAANDFEKHFDLTQDGTKNFISYLGYGYALHKMNNHERENEIFKMGRKNLPNNPDIIFGQAVCALSQGDTAKANNFISEYRSIVDSQYGWSEAAILNSIGNIYEQADEIVSAEGYYRKALSLEPENIWIMNNLAYLLIDRDINLEEGMDLVNQIMEKTQNVNRTLSNLILGQKSIYLGWEPVGYWKILDTYGWGLYKQGKYEESLEVLNQAIDYYRYYEHIVHQHIEIVTKALNEQSETKLN
jgi:Tfp pilus assembly protein PilF